MQFKPHSLAYLVWYGLDNLVYIGFPAVIVLYTIKTHNCQGFKTWILVNEYTFHE